MLHSPQAHPSQSDLVLQLRKECFYFPALALRCREGRHGRPISGPLSRRFSDDRERQDKLMEPRDPTGAALVANSLCRGQEKRTMRELEVQIANSC